MQVHVWVWSGDLQNDIQLLLTVTYFHAMLLYLGLMGVNVPCLSLLGPSTLTVTTANVLLLSWQAIRLGGKKRTKQRSSCIQPWLNLSSFLSSVIKISFGNKYTLPLKAKIGHILGDHTGVTIAAVVVTVQALKTLPHARLSCSVPWCFSERDGLDVQHLNLVHRADSECVIIHQSKTAIGKNRKVP